MARVSAKSDDQSLKAGWKPDAKLELDPIDPELHIYRASELGLCTAALSALAQGTRGEPMPETLRPALDAGIRHEDGIVARFCAEYGYRNATMPELATLREAGTIAGVDPISNQVQVRGAVGKTAIIRGHADRLIVHVKSGEFYLLEVKAFTKSTYDEWKRNGFKNYLRYAMQSTAMILCTGLPQFFVVALLDDERETIVELDQVLIPADKPPVPFGKVKAAVLNAEKYAQRGETPPCVVGRWPCPMFKQPFCLGQAPAEVMKIDDPDFGDMLDRFVGDNIAIRQANISKDAAKETFIAYMADHGLMSGVRYQFENNGGETFEFEWIERTMPESVHKATTQRFPQVKKIEKTTAKRGAK